MDRAAKAAELRSTAAQAHARALALKQWTAALEAAPVTVTATSAADALTVVAERVAGVIALSSPGEGAATPPPQTDLVGVLPGSDGLAAAMRQLALQGTQVLDASRAASALAATVTGRSEAHAASAAQVPCRAHATSRHHWHARDARRTRTADMHLKCLPTLHAGPSRRCRVSNTRRPPRRRRTMGPRPSGCWRPSYRRFAKWRTSARSVARLGRGYTL